MSSARDHDHTAGVKLESHTPGQTAGPWFTEKSSADFWMVTTDDQPFAPTVAYVFARAGRDAQANAQLIAAAPELLAALRQTSGLLLDYIRAAGETDSDDAAVLATARAAIAKALGPQTAGESSRADPSLDNLAEKAG